MNPVLDQWKSQLSTLPPEERAELAHFLLCSLEPAEEGVDTAWDEEASKGSGGPFRPGEREVDQRFAFRPARAVSVKPLIIHEAAQAEVESAAAHYPIRTLGSWSGSSPGSGKGDRPNSPDARGTASD